MLRLPGQLDDPRTATLSVGSGKVGVAEAGTDRQDTPLSQLRLEWHLAQPLYDRIIMHQDCGVSADCRNQCAKAFR